jgi:hypothetical protein
MTQNNLGNALRALGERESGTARLAEAVTAFRDALEELTPERAPHHCAITRNTAGGAANVKRAAPAGLSATHIYVARASRHAIRARPIRRTRPAHPGPPHSGPALEVSRLLTATW